MKTYNTVACGGTFDLLHVGHEYFLDQVLDISQNVILGLTSDIYIQQNKASRGIASFDERKKALEKYLIKKGALERVQIIPIHDLYGPLLDKDLDVDALVVADENKNNADIINNKRVELDLSSLPVETIAQLKDSNDQVISATRVRDGEIDRTGRSLLLPIFLRHALQTAWGEILEHTPIIEDSSRLATVGDVTTRKFMDHGVIPALSIVDNRVERVDVKTPILFENTVKLYHLDNPSGTINKEIFSMLSDIFKSNVKTVIQVSGEEDLLVLPVLSVSPIGMHVYYGQPHEGMVKIIVTSELKDKANKILTQFDKVSSV